MTPDPRSLVAPPRHWARVAEDRPFLDFQDLDGPAVSLTYGEFYDRVRRLAAGLAAEGLRSGDRCVVHTGNTAGFLAALFAVLEAGAVAVPTIVQYSADELRYVVRHSGAWGVITRADLLTTVHEATDGSSTRVFVELDVPAGDPQQAPGGGRRTTPRSSSTRRARRRGRRA